MNTQMSGLKRPVYEQSQAERPVVDTSETQRQLASIDRDLDKLASDCVGLKETLGPILKMPDPQPEQEESTKGETPLVQRLVDIRNMIGKVQEIVTEIRYRIDL